MHKKGAYRMENTSCCPSSKAGRSHPDKTGRGNHQLTKSHFTPKGGRTMKRYILITGIICMFCTLVVVAQTNDWQLKNTDGNVLMHVGDNGNVGIGVTNPEGALHLKAGSTLQIGMEDGGYGTSTILLGGQHHESVPYAKLQTAGDQGTWPLTARLEIRAFDDDPPTMSLMQRHRVGIGVAEPEGTLHLKANSTLYMGKGDYGTSTIWLGGPNHTSEPYAKLQTAGDQNEDTARLEIYLYGDADGKPTMALWGETWTDNGGTLRMWGGAFCNGYVWQEASSIKYKENVENLPLEDALETLEGLNPVTFNYKIAREDQCVGFIAEDVPDLVATPEREGLSSMDIVAVLTKVVQNQQKAIEELQKEVDELKTSNR